MIKNEFPVLVAALLAVAFAAAGLVVNRFDAAHPAPAQLLYALDQDTGRATWASTEADPGAWTSGYVGTGRVALGGAFPALGGAAYAVGPAPVAPLQAPLVTIVANTGKGINPDERVLTVRVRSRRPARLLSVQVEGPRPRSMTVMGRAVGGEGLERGGRAQVVVHAPPADGVVVGLVVPAGAPVRLRVADGSDGLAGLPGFRPRPAGVGVAGSHTGELVLVAKSYPVG